MPCFSTKSTRKSDCSSLQAMDTKEDNRIPITLLPHQEHWNNRLTSILNKFHFGVDVSQLGSGKSYTAAYQAQNRNLPLIVIGPATLAVEWQRISDNHYPLTFITYAALRGSKRCQIEETLKHNLLSRVDNKVGKYEVTTYKPTDSFLKLINKGVVVVVDEIHNIKNKSATRDAVEALLQPILSSTSSYTVLLSGLPFDRDGSVSNLMYTLNIAKTKPYSASATQKRGPFGVTEVVEWFYKIDPRATEEVVNSFRPILYYRSIHAAKSVTWHLFKNIGRSFVGGCKAPSLDCSVRKYNSYYTMSDKATKAYMLAMNMLITIMKDGEIDMSQVSTAFRLIEKASCDTMVEESIKVLEKNKKAKVILYVMYLDSYEILSEKLEKYGVLILNGKLNIKQKTQAINEFHKNPNKRVFLVGLRVGGSGLNLQDTVGDAPRYSFMIPSYYFLDLYQASGRTHRLGAKSDSEVRIIHNKNFDVPRIIENIREKSKLGSDVMDVAQLKAMLPFQYPKEDC